MALRPAPRSAADRFLALLRPIERDLETYSRRLVWQREDALDALQNAVIRAFAAFNRYDERANFRAWMFKILTYEAFALNRKHARIARHEFQLEPEELAGLPSEEVPSQSRPRGHSLDELQEYLQQNLVAGMKTLTDNERAVLLLRAIGELRYGEIAESLDIPIGSVMGHLARARQKMRALIKRPAKPTGETEETET